jgi:hypothetical protein
MSTSSGREGFCTRCGHANNEHARQRESKCKKCKKGFEICQAGVHFRSLGWKLCFIPCGCGKKYYPDKAKSAVPLEPHEYVPDHPGYRPLYLDEDEDNTTIDDSQADASGAEESISTPQKRESVAQSGHGRTDSGESEDALAWSPGTYEQRMGPVAGLVEDLSNTHIDDPSSESTNAVKGGDGDAGIGDWCDWYWSPEYECHTRRRNNVQFAGGWEYEYGASGAAKGKEKESESRSSHWSDWYWSTEYNCEARHRENSAVEGGWEYEYRPADTAKGKESESRLSSWSDWYWSTEYNCEARHRENSAVAGGWEFEYRQTSATSAPVPKSKKNSRSGKGKGKAK